MIHTKLGNGDLEGIAKVALRALTEARSQATSPAGSVAIENADGTVTMLGAANETGTTLATHIGDTEAPPIPSGVTASGSGGMLTVCWDGTLAEETPPDFLQVNIYATDDDGRTLVGSLREAGSVSSGPYSDGHMLTLTATAEDDACDDQGNQAHNVSDECAPIAVTVSDDASHAAEMAAEAAAAVRATNQHFWWGASGAHVATTAGDGDSGPNVVLSSGGMVIRDGTNPLTAATPSGFSVYDGKGNDASNTLALLSRDTIELGRNNSDATVKMCGGAALVRSDVTGPDTEKDVTVQIGPNFKPDGVGTGAVKACSIGLVPFESYTGEYPIPADVGLFFRYDGTTTPATSKVQAYNSDMQVDGILMTPAMNHANLHAEPVYSGVVWNTNGYGGINLSVVRGMAVMRVDINIKTGTVKRWGKVLPPSIIKAMETWAKPPADGVQLRSAAGVGGWVASLNSGGNGKYYLWPTVESAPAGSSLTDTFMWPVDYGR